MAQVDLDVVPVLETESAGALVGAEAEERLGGDDMAASALASRDSLELPELFEWIDADVRVGADADPDASLAHALDRQEPVAEICLCRRTGTDARTGARDQVELAAVGMRCMDDRRPLAQAAGAVEQLDGTQPVLLETLLDLARLFVCVNVQRQPLSGRVPADLLQPAGWACTHGVGGKPDREPAAAQVLHLAEVLGDGVLPEPRQSTPSIRGEQHHDADSGLRRRLDGRQRLLEAEIVEFADGGVTGRAELAIDLGVLAPHELGRLPFRLGQHRLPPGPEIASPDTAAQGPLKGMAVGIDESREAEGLGHGRILSTPMATRAVSAPLQQLPNALTIARLILIPVFVALMLSAEGGHSWPAGIVFGVAGVTDQIDGFLARRWRVESDFGRVWDPLADRLMIDAAVILLFAADHMPWAGLVVILGRDLLLLAGYKAIAPQGYEVRVNVVGKAATWVLYLGIGCLLVTHRSTEWPYWIFWTGLVLAVVAGVEYAVGAWRQRRR